MKARFKITLIALSILTLNACRQDAPTVPAKATESVATANAVDAVAVVENSASTVGPTLDAKALAGSFGNGESVLELRADGTYLQTLWVAGNEITADGSWSAQDGSTLLLDPSSKSAEDAGFKVVSNDELRSIDGKHVFLRISSQ